MSYFLLTGATGLLGNYLLRDLLLADVPVAVIGRSNRRQSARQRIEVAMCGWDAEVGRALPRPVVMEGDISQPDLGLNANDVVAANYLATRGLRPSLTIPVPPGNRPARPVAVAARSCAGC